MEDEASASYSLDPVLKLLLISDKKPEPVPIYVGTPFKFPYHVASPQPLWNCVVGKVSTGGRNNLGRITSRAKGSGHKKRYRMIDFYRNKLDVKAKVERIEYDPNRTSFIALVKYEDGVKNYIICPRDLNVGDDIVSGNKKEIKTGNCMPLSDIPPGTLIHNVELIEGNGGKIARSAGSSVTLSGFDSD